MNGVFGSQQQQPVFRKSISASISWLPLSGAVSADPFSDRPVSITMHDRLSPDGAESCGYLRRFHADHVSPRDEMPQSKVPGPRNLCDGYESQTETIRHQLSVCTSQLCPLCGAAIRTGTGRWIVAKPSLPLRFPPVNSHQNSLAAITNGSSGGRLQIFGENSVVDPLTLIQSCETERSTFELKGAHLVQLAI